MKNLLLKALGKPETLFPSHISQRWTNQLTRRHCFLTMFPEGGQTRKHCFLAMFPKDGQTRKHCSLAMFPKGDKPGDIS
jgi:hypothetical protein